MIFDAKGPLTIQIDLIKTKEACGEQSFISKIGFPNSYTKSQFVSVTLSS